MSLSSLDNYQKGTRAWFADAVDGWISATLSERQARPSTARGQKSSPRAQVTADHVKLVFSDEKGRVRFCYRRCTTHTNAVTDADVRVETVRRAGVANGSVLFHQCSAAAPEPALARTDRGPDQPLLPERTQRYAERVVLLFLAETVTQSCIRYGHGMSFNRSTPTLASFWLPSIPSVQWVPSSDLLLETTEGPQVPLYSSDYVQMYAGKRKGDLDPHLFAIAEEAYRCMIREGKNQTIIVSGERCVTWRFCTEVHGSCALTAAQARP
jgi:hypothetical protein